MFLQIGLKAQGWEQRGQEGFCTAGVQENVSLLFVSLIFYFCSLVLETN